VGQGLKQVGDAVPARAASLRPQPASRFSQSGIAIAGPSPDFIRRSRNPDLASPARFEPTPKNDGDVVI
jgi:hypothetical protein